MIKYTKARIIEKEVKGTHEKICGINGIKLDHLLHSIGLLQARS